MMGGEEFSAALSEAELPTDWIGIDFGTGEDTGIYVGGQPLDEAAIARMLSLHAAMYPADPEIPAGQPASIAEATPEQVELAPDATDKPAEPEADMAGDDAGGEGPEHADEPLQEVPVAGVTSCPAPEPEPAASRELLRTPDRTGEPWTPEQDRQLLDMRRRGVTMAVVASELGRSVATCWNRASALKKAREHEAAKAEAAKSEATKAAAVAAVQASAAKVTPPAPKIEPAPQPTLSTDMPPQLRDQIWAREICARLDALGHVRPWTPALDLELVEKLHMGMKTPQLADELGIDAQLVKARYIALLPETGIENQGRLLAVLRARVASK